ncbi:hypothetical protein SLA2020_239240 [Shorea laevis]
MDSRQLTAESVPLFQEGIGLLLSRWSVLQLAVQNEWAAATLAAKLSSSSPMSSPSLTTQKSLFALMI